MLTNSRDIIPRVEAALSKGSKKAFGIRINVESNNVSDVSDVSDASDVGGYFIWDCDHQFFNVRSQVVGR